MRTLLTTAALTAALTLTACSSDDTSAGKGDTPPQTSEAAQEDNNAPGPGDDASTIADTLQKSVSHISDRVEITEDNDPNNLIGRPGQYDQAILLVDSRLGCQGPSYNDVSSDCGVKLERWASEEDAQARMDDIQQKLKDYGLGAEYDYIVGRTLVRVAGDLKPSEAAEYEDALR